MRAPLPTLTPLARHIHAAARTFTPIHSALALHPTKCGSTLAAQNKARGTRHTRHPVHADRL